MNKAIKNYFVSRHEFCFNLEIMEQNCNTFGARSIPSIIDLRTVPTIVIAHTFCASRDTRISYR